MPRDINGNYTLPAGNPVVSGTIIDTNWANPTLADIANELTNSLSRDGEGGMLAPLRFQNGSATVPAISWINETNTGFYRAGTHDMRASVNGIDSMRWIPDAVQVWNEAAQEWQAIDGFIISETAPNDPSQGTVWLRCTDFKTFIWYIDDDGGQWVEENPSMGAPTHNAMPELNAVGGHDAIYERVFDNVASMIAYSGVVDGITVKTKGRLKDGDGQGATYLVQTMAEFGSAPDEAVDFSSTVDASLVFFNIRIKDTQPTAYAKDFQRFTWGNEYLYALIRAQRGGDVAKCVFSGDSTTLGTFTVDGVDSPLTWKPDIVMDRLAKRYGVPINAVNSGHGGQSTVLWNTFYLGQDITNHPDMNAYFMRWGINDASEHEDPSVYETNLDAGLTTLRAFKSARDLSIVLMMPNNTDDPTNSRTSAWYEQIVDINYRMAQKHQCYFFDTYAFIRDVTTGATWWMDKPVTGDNGTVHPSNEMQLSIYDYLAREVFAPSQAAGNNQLQNIPASYDEPLFTKAPNLYETGIKLERATLPNGWPIDGTVVTTRSADDNVTQVVSGFEGTIFVTKTRYGAGTGGSWGVPFSGTKFNATLESGWTVDAGREPLGYSIDAEGFVSIEGQATFGGTPAAGDLIFTLPAKFRPAQIYTSLFASSNGVTNVLGALNVFNDGRVTVSAIGSDGTVNCAGIRFKARN